jgi:hypothetical protein
MSTIRELNEEDFDEPPSKLNLPPLPSHEIDLKYRLSNMPDAPTGAPIMKMVTKTLTKEEVAGLRVHRAKQFTLFISTMFDFINHFFDDCKLNAYPPCIKDKVLHMHKTVNELNNDIHKLDAQINQYQNGGNRRKTRKKRARKRTNKRK